MPIHRASSYTGIYPVPTVGEFFNRGFPQEYIPNRICPISEEQVNINN